MANSGAGYIQGTKRGYDLNGAPKNVLGGHEPPTMISTKGGPDNNHTHLKRNQLDSQGVSQNSGPRRMGCFLICSFTLNPSKHVSTNPERPQIAEAPPWTLQSGSGMLTADGEGESTLAPVSPPVAPRSGILRAYFYLTLGSRARGEGVRGQREGPWIL